MLGEMSHPKFGEISPLTTSKFEEPRISSFKTLEYMVGGGEGESVSTITLGVIGEMMHPNFGEISLLSGVLQTISFGFSINFDIHYIRNYK